MKLRSRFALTLIGLVVPLAIGLTLVQNWLRERSFRETAAAFVIARMEGERELCEQFPETWPAPPRFQRPRFRERLLGEERPLPRRRGNGMHAYSSTFVSTNPQAPAFDPDLRRDLENGGAFATRHFAAGPRGRRLIAVRMPWETGPCAIVVASQPEPRPPGGVVGALAVPIAVAIAAGLIAVFAVGPIVRRIRVLTANVQRKARDDSAVLRGSDEIGELARAFESSRREIETQVDQLRQRDQALTEYIANTTHDVMVPLTVLQGHLVALQKQAARNEAPSANVVALALEESHYLGSLLHNLSVAAKLDSGQLNPEPAPVDLSALVERVATRHAPIARAKGVSLEYAVPERSVTVAGDVTLIEQAVNNLVHNAIRYNRDRGHVAMVLEMSGENFSLRVIDDGPGVAPEQLHKLGERRFRSSEARSRHPDGRGLGLNIARDVADRHRWRLEFRHSDYGGLEVEMHDRERPA